MWILIISKWVLVIEWANATNFTSKEIFENEFKNED